jgi:hypothetical protein
MRRGARGKGQRRVLDHGHGVFVLAACAGEARRDESDRCLTGTSGETVELERVSGEADAAVQRADHRPRLTAAHRQVLASGEHAPALRVGERRVVDVLANVVLVHADCAVVRQRKVLRVDEVHGDLGVCRVLHPDVPQPRGAFLGEHQRERDAEPEALAGRSQPGGVEPQRERTTRPEKWRPRDLVAKPPQIEVGWPALHLRSREQVEHDVAVLHAADRAVGVHVHGKPGGALVAAGLCHRGVSFIGRMSRALLRVSDAHTFRIITSPR